MNILTHEEKRRFLARCPLFGGFEGPTLDRLAQRLAERRFADRQLIFGRGDPGSSMMVVVEGHVRISLTSADGKEVLLCIVGPGQTFGEMALLDGRARSADATAHGHCRALVLDRRELLPLLAQSAEAALKLCGVICDRLRTTSERLEGAVLMPVEGRLARLLLSLADESTPALSQADIGRLIGASRQQVNLHLGRMLADGLLERRGAMLSVVDRRGLNDIAETAAA